MTWRTSPDIPAAPPQTGFSLISNEKLFALYIAMVRSRLINERMRASGPNGRAAFASSSKGQEAALVGAAIDLLPQDTVAPAFWGETSYRIVNPSARVATTSDQFLKAARKNKKIKNSKIGVILSTNTSTSSSEWQSVLEAVSKERLPVLLVSWNATVAGNVSVENKPLASEAAFPTINVDGADVVAVYRVASEAIVHARKGNRPTLIECYSEASSDPLKNMENYLIKKSLLATSVKQKISAALRSELDLNLPIGAA